MSEWNLSVRLTGQGSGLARTLRDVASDARSASNEVNALRRNLTLLRTEASNAINIRLDVDGDHLRSDVTAALAAAGSGQGIGVRLDVDADHLRDDVTSALTAAGSAQNIRIRLDLDADHLQGEVQAALTAAGAGQGMRVRLDLDSGHIRDDITTALTNAGNGQGVRVRLDVDADHLRDDVQAALTAAGAGQNITVDLNVDGAASLAELRAEAGQTAHSLNTLQRATREAKNELEELEGRAVTTAAALRRINTAATQGRTSLNDLSGSTRSFRTDLDELDGSLTRVGDNLGNLRGRIGGLGGGSGGGSGGSSSGMSALKGLLLLAPAALPLVAGLSTSLAPLPGLLGAASVSAAAFGIALGGQVERLGEVADAEKKYQDAVREHGKSSAEALTAQLKYQQMLAELPPDAQRAAVALSQLKQNFSDWSDEMSGFTMEPLTKGITVLDQLIPRLTPHVKSFSTQLDRVVTVAGGAVDTPGFDAMADRFADFSDRQLEDMTDGVMHFLRVLSEGGAFQGGPIAEFMAYARENGPGAREALSAISDAVVTLLRGASEAGPSMLTLVTAAANLVAALPPELVGIILQVAAGLKLVQLAGAGAAAIAGGVAALGTRLTALRAASTAAGGGMAGLAAAFGTLGTAAKATLIASGIGILLIALSELSDMGKQAPPDVDKLTTSLRQLSDTGKVTGEAARSFGKDLSGLADSLQKVTDPKGLDQVQQSIVSLFGTDSTPVKEAKENIDAVDKALANLVKNGQADLAAAALEELSAKLKDQGFSAEEIRGQMDDYKSALADARFEQELAAQSMGLFGQQAQQTSAKLAEQKQSADGLRQAIQALNDVHREGLGGMIGFEAAIDAASKAAEKNAGALNMVNGVLDLNSPKAQEAATALNDLAAKTDEAAAAARESGQSWSTVNGIYERGRQQLIQNAVQMGLTRAEAERLASTILKTPNKTALLKADITDWKAKIAEAESQLKTAKGDKRAKLTADILDWKVKVAEAEAQLRRAKGDKTARLSADISVWQAKVRQAEQQLKNAKGEKRARLTADISDLQAKIRAANAALNSVNSKRIVLTTEHRTIYTGKGGRGPNAAGGGLLASLPKQRLATGGAVQGFPAGGYIQGPGTSTSDSILASFPSGAMARVSNSEFVVQAAAVRKYGVQTLNAINSGQMMLPRLAAGGSVTDWRYDPQTGSLYSGSDITSAGNKTRKVKVKGKGGKVTIKEIEYFDLGAVEKKLKSASKATLAWNKDLEKVADRVGGDVAEALASMGKEGMQLAHKMANGSTKYINDMTKALRDLQKTAKASLTDYTRQLGTANKLNKEFADDLARLAAMGYGDLAGQLAAQNDEAAQQLADAAVKDKKKAAAADKQAKAANNALTADQVQSLVQIIAAISSNKVGIHDVAAKTGLGEDEIIAIANKAKGQIHSSLGSRATKFLSDLGKANKFQAYADGGIRAGLYATRGGLIRFAEPETGGEAFIPLGASKRRSALPVLTDVASRFGLGLKSANEGRVIIIREQSPVIGSLTIPVHQPRASAHQIADTVAYQMRRAQRGGARR